MHSAVRDGAKSCFVALRTWSLKQGTSNSMEKGREMMKIFQCCLLGCCENVSKHAEGLVLKDAI